MELLAGIGAAYSAWRFGPTMAALGAMLFVWFTIALAFIDQETGLLPDDLTLPLVWAGLVVNLGGAFVPLRDAVIGAAAGYLSLWLIFWAYKLATGKEGMGYGDFKMNAAVGAFLGWKMLPLVILLSSLVGLAFGAVVRSSCAVSSEMTVKWRTVPDTPPSSFFGVHVLRPSKLSEYQ